MIKKKNNSAEPRKKREDHPGTARYLDLNERLTHKATIRHLVCFRRGSDKCRFFCSIEPTILNEFSIILPTGNWQFGQWKLHFLLRYLPPLQSPQRHNQQNVAVAQTVLSLTHRILTWFVRPYLGREQLELVVGLLYLI